MTKFEELCQAFAKSREDFRSYRDACGDFAAVLLNGFREYLKCPPTQIKVTSLNDEEDLSVCHIPIGTMHLREDTFWHIGLTLVLYEAANVYPQETAIVRIKIKKSGNIFHVVIADSENVIKVDDSKDQDMNEIFDKISDLLLQNYEAGVEYFLEQDKSTRKIGYHR